MLLPISWLYVRNKWSLSHRFVTLCFVLVVHTGAGLCAYGMFYRVQLPNSCLATMKEHNVDMHPPSFCRCENKMRGGSKKYQGEYASVPRIACNSRRHSPNHLSGDMYTTTDSTKPQTPSQQELSFYSLCWHRRTHLTTAARYFCGQKTMFVAFCSRLNFAGNPHIHNSVSIPYDRIESNRNKIDLSVLIATSPS